MDRPLRASRADLWTTLLSFGGGFDFDNHTAAERHADLFLCAPMYRNANFYAILFKMGKRGAGVLAASCVSIHMSLSFGAVYFGFGGQKIKNQKSFLHLHLHKLDPIFRGNGNGAGLGLRLVAIFTGSSTLLVVIQVDAKLEVFLLPTTTTTTSTSRIVAVAARRSGSDGIEVEGLVYHPHVERVLIIRRQRRLRALPRYSITAAAARRPILVPIPTTTRIAASCSSFSSCCCCCCLSLRRRRQGFPRVHRPEARHHHHPSFSSVGAQVAPVDGVSGPRQHSQRLSGGQQLRERRRAAHQPPAGRRSTAGVIDRSFFFFLPPPPFLRSRRAAPRRRFSSAGE